MKDSYKLQKKLSKLYLLFKESFDNIFYNEKKIKELEDKYEKEYISYTILLKEYIKDIVDNFIKISSLIKTPLEKITDYEPFNNFEKISSITTLLDTTKKNLLQINENIFKMKQKTINSYNIVINILAHFNSYNDESSSITAPKETQLLKEFKIYLDNFIEVHKKQLE